MKQHDLIKDLHQEIELIALEASREETTKEAGKIIGHGFGQFLYKTGLRKSPGKKRKLVLMERCAGSDWWEEVERTGITPDGFDTKIWNIFQGRKYNKKLRRK